jgi:hypothetical protein
MIDGNVDGFSATAARPVEYPRAAAGRLPFEQPRREPFRTSTATKEFLGSTSVRFPARC